MGPPLAPVVPPTSAQRHASRCFVSIANSAVWLTITGEQPPTKPPSTAEYTKAGLPWFDCYGGNLKAVGGASVLAKLLTVVGMKAKKGEATVPGNDLVEVGHVIPLPPRNRMEVRQAAL